VSAGGFDDGRNEAAQMSQPHILCINGSPVFLDLLRALFQEESFNVTTTNFVPRSWEMIDALQPSVIILDLVIGQQAGWNLLRQLHAEATTRAIPLVVTSTDPHLLEEARHGDGQWGGDAFISKPLDVEDLIRTTRRLVSCSRRHNGNEPEAVMDGASSPATSR
jgi:DNA-binding response OmpR family regulator